MVEKAEKPKTEQDEADDDSSRGSEKPDNNDNSENEDVSIFVYSFFPLKYIPYYNALSFCLILYFSSC